MIISYFSDESRKQFKTFVNILATIKTENNEKYLVLRKKYLNTYPTEDIITGDDGAGISRNTNKDIGDNIQPMSPGSISLSSDFDDFVFKTPPPYKPPPSVISTNNTQIPILQNETKENYRDCVNEFQAAMTKLNLNASSQSSCEELENDNKNKNNENLELLSVPNSPCVNDKSEKVIVSGNNNKENIEQKSENQSECDYNDNDERINMVSVKEAARKFNRLASEEETKILSPSNKKKVEKVSTYVYVVRKHPDFCFLKEIISYR